MNALAWVINVRPRFRGKQAALPMARLNPPHSTHVACHYWKELTV